jgi:hypothetical protein
MAGHDTIPIAGQTPSAGPGQTARAWAPPRTPDGQYDLQGIWDFSTITPLERPGTLGDKQVFSDEEAAVFEREENRRQNRDLIDPKTGGGQYPPGGVIPYNEVWYERGDKIIGSKRTSLIVDPRDGRLPPLTPEGEKRSAALAASAAEVQQGRVHADSWMDLTLADRCILGFNAGPPMTPGAYNNHVQIVQAPGTVALTTEMVHNTRVIRLDAGERLRSRLRQYAGDSHAQWAGRTLVVDTTNFLRETSLRGSSPATHVIERFTRADPDTLLYEFTVEDATMWTRPWTALVPMKKVPGPIYEYACHEGNYAIGNILRGARALERQQ